MKPIWYFVGLILLSMGGLIALTDVYYMINPIDANTVLAEIHPRLWWGSLMFIAGVIYVVKNKNVTID